MNRYQKRKAKGVKKLMVKYNDRGDTRTYRQAKRIYSVIQIINMVKDDVEERSRHYSFHEDLL